MTDKANLIIQEALSYYNITKEEALAKSKVEKPSNCRAMIYYFLKKYEPSLETKEIATALGRKYHTVQSSLNTTKRHIKTGYGRTNRAISEIDALILHKLEGTLMVSIDIQYINDGDLITIKRLLDKYPFQVSFEEPIRKISKEIIKRL